MNSLQRKQPPVFPVERVIIPEVQSLNLKNGVPVYLINAGTEDIMRLEIIFRAGQVRERLPLLSSTTNMMLSEGSQNYTSEEMNRLIDYYGTFLNLSPEKDLAGAVLFFLSKHIEKVLELTRELIFRPLFPEPELNALMKKRLRWFLVNKEKASNQAIDKFFESSFGKLHPYGRQLTEKDFESMNPSIIREFHSEYYTPDNMTLIISGKIHPRTTELLNHYFGEIASVKKQKKDPEIKIRGKASKEIHIVKDGAVQTAVRIGSPTINKRNPDYPGLKILNTILGGYFGWRLMKNLREEKGFTYGIGSAVSSLNLSGYKVISTEVSPKNCSQTIDEIFNEIRLLQNVPVSADELAVVRNYMSGEMVRMFDGPFAIAESFRAVWEFGLDNSYYQKLSEKILKIDPDEIIELARTYYNIDELYQVTVGPNEKEVS
ncbi:MAG: insulinase family protein [Bacteroidales bacterium]|nr:insulinase family protein [Bacteroidales bacterium]